MTAETVLSIDPNVARPHKEQTAADGAFGTTIQFPSHRQNIVPRTNAAFDYYMSLRDLAAESLRPEGDELLSIQADVRSWIEAEGILDQPVNYTDYDLDAVEAKIGVLAEYIEREHADKVPSEDIESTRAFVGNAFAMYGNRNLDGSPAEDGDGSFAFVVPPRMSRLNSEYGEEVEPVIPLLRYVPNELRAQMMVGLPPFVIDTYEKDDHHRRGYLIFAPVYPDMMADMPRMKAIEKARQHVNNAVDFAVGRFGVRIVGLGATLPAVTRYGNTISNEHVITTTGHGGTTHLIKETLKEGLGRGYVNGNIPPKIGVLGLGAIGASIAELVGTEFPDSPLTIFDSAEKTTEDSLRNLKSKNIAAQKAIGERELIEECDVIISAITSQIDLENMKGLDLKDKFIIDDSQPGSFSPAQVSARGGQLAWVVGHDTAGSIVRRGYDYGTLVNGQLDLFGCEAEAAALAQYEQALLDKGHLPKYVARMLSKVALRSPVTPKHARVVGGILKRAGVRVAELQNFGEYLRNTQKITQN